jgi:hypothetical protein
LGYALHLHTAHCLSRTCTVTMKLQIRTTKFSPEIQIKLHGNTENLIIS